MDSIIHLEGFVERVTYHNEETGYAVLKIQVRGQKDLISVLGHLSVINPGESISAQGHWIQNKDYGKQFQAHTIEAIHPSSLQGIEKYLGSGMVKGIGPHFASKLVKNFGSEVFEVIEKNPLRLKEIGGIGSKRIQKITSAWKDQKIIRSIMVFLHSHGVSSSKAVRIFKTYGENAIERVKANPYQLAKDIHGIGFKSADRIANQLGISKDSVIRAQAGLSYILMDHVQEGHCAYPETLILKQTVELLEIKESIVKKAIEIEITEESLVREELPNQKLAQGLTESCLYLASIYYCEKKVAALLAALYEKSVPWTQMDTEKAITWVEKKISISLAPLQKEAVKQSISSKLSLITGGPGTGKSTITRAILTLLKEKGMRIALCSPTGRAAKRLSECTGMEAKTIHRTLGFDPKKNGGFSYDREQPLPIDLLLIDEASMIDIQLMYSLLKAVPPHAALIIIGDRDQLPSVGPGSVLADMIDSKVFPTIKLTQIFRQAAQSQIIQAAHQINQGIVPDLKHLNNSDFYFIHSENPQMTLSKINELIYNRIPKKFKIDPIRDIQVLSPMQKGVFGARNLNTELKKILNPTPSESIERFGYNFSEGDKVMVISNDYNKEVFNGDMGFIKKIHLTDQECTVDFDGKDILFEFGEMDILQPAYAITIHKSQGSEYPAVIIPMSTQHYLMLQKNLVYTGITRGKKLVILIGQEKALRIAIRTVHQNHRWGNLKQRICNSFTK